MNESGTADARRCTQIDPDRINEVTEKVIGCAYAVGNALGCKALDEIHMAQCLNYLKATGLPLCLLINFGKTRVEVKRVVLHL